MKALRWVTGIGVILIAAGAFALSFAKLYAVGERAEYGGMSWIYPAIVEGFTTLCTLAAFLRHGKRGAWYPWMVGLAAFGFSLWANSLPDSVPVEVVRAVPVICIPLAVHMFIIISGLVDKAERNTPPAPVAVPEFDTVADMFPTVAEQPPAVEPVDVQPVDQAEPITEEIEPVKVEARERKTVLADADAYRKLAEQAKTAEKREFWLKMAAQAA
ncbi:hypothetical protein GCM10029963_28630 [Micromonospora andamanensis]|uniref:DUF2637 domain-containing protein n=1 Tax=Micromonospora andamanensis TaxID=1287068 RepID=UPI00194FEB15|nr:DUF2637 domain-containing protein [Micromonospora andamanensis]GIJ38503.1 hypothetical protein Vwe01_18280 [Micromonospora andamanensis]